MEKNTNAGVIEKTETSRRTGKTETKAETIMTMSKKTTRFVTETSDKQVSLEFSKKRDLNLFYVQMVTPPNNVRRAPKLGQIGRVNSTSKNGKLIFASQNVSLDIPSWDFDDASSIEADDDQSI